MIVCRKRMIHTAKTRDHGSLSEQLLTAGLERQLGSVDISLGV
jgi:hypothetical protein